jgi:U3 small nucleolar RNA-associated protein 18
VLRARFERLHPRPEWANRRTQTGTPSLSSLLATTKSFVAIPERGTRGSLPQGTIEIQRLRNANQQSPTVGKREAVDAGGGVVDFAWHPNPKVGVVAVAGGDRRVRFFNVSIRDDPSETMLTSSQIDGHTNPSLMTLHIPSLPLTRATFHPSGSSLLLTGSRPFYCTYDLPSQRCLRSPRNLFGSVRSPTSPNSLSRHAFSPDGSLLAVAGRRGAVSVLDWSGTGVGAVVAELRSGRGASVVDLVWSVDGRELSVLGGRDGAEVEVWDVGERKVVRKWQDDRAFGGAIMRRSGDGAYTAIG